MFLPIAYVTFPRGGVTAVCAAFAAAARWSMGIAKPIPMVSWLQLGAYLRKGGYPLPTRTEFPEHALSGTPSGP